MKIELKILNKEFYKQNDCTEWVYDNPLPYYATPGSAAMDLVCTKDITIDPQERVMIPTGLAIWIGSHNDNALRSFRPHWGIAGLILPRSGLGTKGLVLANTVGLIDEDYQGELMVSAWNTLPPNPDSDINWYDGAPEYWDDNEIVLKAGDRFAQLMFVPIIKAQWQVVEEFSKKTERNIGAFGSTGG